MKQLIDNYISTEEARQESPRIQPQSTSSISTLDRPAPQIQGRSQPPDSRSQTIYMPSSSGSRRQNNSSINAVVDAKFEPYKTDFRAKKRKSSKAAKPAEFKISKVILLPVPSCYTLNKSQRNFIASCKLYRDNVEFTRNDSQTDIRSKLIKRFEPHLKNMDFSILKAEGDMLVEPILGMDDKLDGENIADIFLKQRKKVMYLQPSSSLKIETKLENPFITEEIIDSPISTPERNPSGEQSPFFDDFYDDHTYTFSTREETREPENSTVIPDENSDPNISAVGN